MDTRDSSTTESWLDIALTNDIQQDETGQSGTAVEEPVSLFGQFVSAVSSDVFKDIQPRSEFSIFVRDLCMKAPSVAQYLAQEILKQSRDDSKREVQASKEVVSVKPLSKKKKSDRTYQPPKSSRVQSDIPAEDSHNAPGINSFVNDQLITCQRSDNNKTINQGSESLITEKVILKCEGGVPKIIAEDIPQDEVQVQPATCDHALPFICSGSALHPLKTTQNAIYKQPLAILDKAAEKNQTIVSTPSLSGEQQETALSEIDGKTSDNQATSAPSSPTGMEPRETTLPGPTPSTPVQQIDRGFQSPLSDDQTVTDTTLFTPIISREVLSPVTEHSLTASPRQKAEMTLSAKILLSPRSGKQAIPCNTASAQAQQVDREQSLLTQDNSIILSPYLPKEAPTVSEMVAKSVHLIYQMSKRPEVPTEAHSRILAIIQPSLPTAVERPDPTWIASSPKDWSATTWINMLEAGYTRSKKVTILNMIEWVGASEWYDAELQKSENAPPPTKRGKPRKRLATVVLDKYLGKARDTTILEGTETPASIDNRGCVLSVNLHEIQKKILDAKRKRLNNVFHRGRSLRKLIQMTHLGILFDPDIWSYAKASKENIDKVAATFQADPQKMELLSILSEQVELLAGKGRPDLSHFFDLLESHSITPSAEVSSLRAEYGLEREPVQQGSLEIAIDRVVEGVHQVLGENSRGDDEFIVVNGVEISCSMLNRLRSKEWLKCWDIGAALQMADRPVFVELSLSIPLHKEDVNGNVTPIPKPFRRWRLKIDECRCEGKGDLERARVYICPLNINANHFTLLEINEQTKMIYHYDSLAGKRINQRKTKLSPTRQVVEEEFKYLGFGYTEAPTPQQEDGWSCGLMAIRNAKRRMMGLPVGTWDDKVDPDRVIKEVVGDCQTFLEDDALQPRPLTKKRKIVEPEPSRSSKRLKK